jgi:CIC family chloride channel protein
MVRASDVMRSSIPTVAPTDSLARASEMMDDFAVRELPVVERGAIVGIITRSDLDPHVGHFEWTPIRVAMSASPRTVVPDAPIGEVVSALLCGDFNAVPVVMDRTLVGMIARRDLLQLLVDRP